MLSNCESFSLVVLSFPCNLAISYFSVCLTSVVGISSRSARAVEIRGRHGWARRCAGWRKRSHPSVVGRFRKQLLTPARPAHPKTNPIIHRAPPTTTLFFFRADRPVGYRFAGFPGRATRRGLIVADASSSSLAASNSPASFSLPDFFLFPVISSRSFRSARCIPTVSWSSSIRSFWRFFLDIKVTRKLGLFYRTVQTRNARAGQEADFERRSNGRMTLAIL